MDFPDRLIDHIERNMNLYSTILIPMLQEGNSIALTPIPSSDAENVYYMDGSIEKTYRFQILVKHKQQFVGYNSLLQIGEFLSGLQEDEVQSSDNSFEFIKCNVSATPNFLGKSEQQEYVYASTFDAELFIKAREEK
ncbi:minor capsid protein [Bacillus sp. PS93]|uniref:phage tail terminator protein n=1 Tax=Bacillus TaxID=1386 RepID=UPI001B9F828F|nr:minor capsid protein [Bacillus subtilis]CAF1815561.1 hypothetical protein NRS6085_03731 [Bacillus subtilis]CAI6304884.1 Bacteriophage minor capsid protein [Bacillus subtilis]